MNIEDVQPWAVSLLVGYPPLAAVSVLADDGTYPKTPGREKALTESGLALVVWQIESAGIVDEVGNGTTIESVLIPVVVEENVAVNGGTTGTGIACAKALRFVREALVGRRWPTERGTIIHPSGMPFRNFGTVNGVQRIVAFFEVQLTIPVTP